jgi:hypothetical protein
MMRSAFAERVFWAAVVVAGLGVAAPASASLKFTFSGFTSDATDPADLDATMTLTVTPLGATGGLTDLLTVSLTNNSSDFTLAAAYWNYTGDATLASLDPAPQGNATLTTSPPPPLSANGFGTYDFLLDLDTMNNGLAPGGGMGSWTIDLGVTGVMDSDFDIWSVPMTEGDPVAVAALFFAQGPDDPEAPGFEDSAFAVPYDNTGGTPPNSIVPEPLSAVLVGTALMGVIAVRRKMA